MITLPVQSVLPVFPTMTGSDNSKHPALKVTSRVKLGKFSQKIIGSSPLKYFQSKFMVCENRKKTIPHLPHLGQK